MAGGKAENKSKISPQFAGRLRRLPPEQRVRVVVMLSIPPGERTSRRQTAAERQAAVAAVRSAAYEKLRPVDAILSRFGGERLAESPNALGSIPVEVTPAGIQALAELDSVKALLEDQPIHPAL